MTTARGLLRKLIFHGRLDPNAPSEPRAVEDRLEAARQRLKQTTPPVPEQTKPPPEVSPEEGSPPVL